MVNKWFIISQNYVSRIIQVKGDYPIGPECTAKKNVKSKSNMRAEIENLKTRIEQSLILLRRSL